MPLLKLFGGSKNKAGSEKRDKTYNDDGGDSKRRGNRRDEKRNRMKDSDRSGSKNSENGRLSKITAGENKEQRRDKRADERTSASSMYRRRSKSMESRLSKNDRDEGKRCREKDEHYDSGKYRTRSSSLVSRRSMSVNDTRKERSTGDKDGGRKDNDDLSRASARDRRRSKSVGSRRGERGKSRDPKRVNEDGSRRKDNDDLSRATSRHRRRSKSVGSRRGERGKSRDPKRVNEDVSRRKDNDDLSRATSRHRRRSKSMGSRRGERGKSKDSKRVTEDDDRKGSESRFRKRSSSVTSKSTKSHDKDGGDAYSTRSDSRIRSRSKADDDEYSTRSDSRIKSMSKSVADSRNRVGMPVNVIRKKTDASSPDGSRRSEERKGRRGENDARGRKNKIDSDYTRHDELKRGGLRYGNERERGIDSILESESYFGRERSVSPQVDMSVGRVKYQKNNGREASVKDYAHSLNSSTESNSSEIGTIGEGLESRNTGAGSNINSVEQVLVELPTYLRNGVRNQQTEALPASFQYASQEVATNMRDLSRQSDQRLTISSVQSIKNSVSTPTQTWRCNSCSNVNDGGRPSCANCGVALPHMKMAALPDPNLLQVRQVDPSDQLAAMQHSNMHSALAGNISRPSHSDHKENCIQHHITSSSAQDRSVTAWRCGSCSNINDKSRLSCMNCGVEAIPSLKGRGDDVPSNEDQVQRVMLAGGIHNGTAGININATSRIEEQREVRQTFQNKPYPSNQRNDPFGHQATGSTVVTIQSQGSPDRLHNTSHSPLPVKNGSHSPFPVRIGRHFKTQDSGNAFATSEKSWTCLECHSRNMNSGPFCTSCGTKAGVSSKTSHQSFPINNMPILWNCGQCAHANDDEHKFCKQCGSNRMNNLSLPAAGQISYSCSSCRNITGRDGCRHCGYNVQSTQQEYSEKTQNSISVEPGTFAQPMLWRCVCSHTNESRRPFCERCGAKAIDKGQPRESSALTAQKKTPVMHKQTKQRKHHSYENSRHPTSPSECESKMRNSQYDVISPPSNVHSSALNPLVLADIASGSASLKSPNPTKIPTAKVSMLSQIKKGKKGLKSVEKRKFSEAPRKERPMSILDQIMSGPQLKKVEKRHPSPSSSSRDGKCYKMYPFYHFTLSLTSEYLSIHR